MDSGAVLLTGATGYIGGKLLTELLGQQVVLRALVRDAARLPQSRDRPGARGCHRRSR